MVQQRLGSLPNNLSSMVYSISASTSTVVLVCGGLYLAALALYRQIHTASDKAEDDSSNDEHLNHKQKSNNKEASTPITSGATLDVIRKPPYFPWEKDDDQHSTKNSSGVSAAPIPLSSLLPNIKLQRNSRQTEEFLASMTFANTGLKIPSCPCCQ